MQRLIIAQIIFGLISRSGMHCLGTVLVLIAVLGASGGQVDLMGPPGSGQFGANVTVLPNGNLLVTDPGYDGPGLVPDVGAVHLYDGASLAVISTLTGSTANDRVGSGGIVVLSNGNFVVRSFQWNGSRGAATWGSGTAGVSGVVSTTNSLIGATAIDQVGILVTDLANGRYAVVSPSWDNGGVMNVGAVTWGDGVTGVNGLVSAANSLVGTKAGDQVGINGVTVLPSGHCVVSSSYWDSGTVTDVGAVTWVNGATGLVGPVSTANSLVGSATGDRVGSGGITVLTNGNYVVSSALWSGRRGAVTWGSGVTGVQGVISSANSLVGSTAVDLIGAFDGVKALLNGNYVVRSPNWDNGATRDAGAVTWGSGAVGVSGVVSPANSLVGSKTGDLVGEGITVLSNGAYVVASCFWDNGAVTNVGAVTWGSGSSGIAGPVSPANSLIGTKLNDEVGYGNVSVTALANGNYVVSSRFWDNGAVVDAGAVTWASGAGGLVGVVSPANSLVGSTAADEVGYITALVNGHYVVSTPSWDHGAVDVGAATWGDGTRGVTGPVSPANSLVGSQANDQVSGSGVTALANGHYVVSSRSWMNGSIPSAGAATWGNGTNGTTGPVSVANSLVGSAQSDQVGSDDFSVGITALANGNYVVVSPVWDDETVLEAGAVTWADGTGPAVGVVAASNSLVGSTESDRVGSAPIEDFIMSSVDPLPDGRYVVRSGQWDNNLVTDAGAVTLGDGLPRSQGRVRRSNGVLGDVSRGGRTMSATFDRTKNRLIVGYPAGNRVSAFSYPLPLTNRVHGRILTTGSPRDDSGRFYHDYDLQGAIATGEHAVYARGLFGFSPALELLDAETLAVLGIASSLEDGSGQCVLLFTNSPGRSYQLNVASAVSSGTGAYDVARYPVVRPGAAVPGALDANDTSSTNRVAAVSDGRWYYDDYLLRGVSAGDRVAITVESGAFAPFLEVRLLSDLSVQDYRDGADYTLAIQGTGEGARDYLLRVTSSASGGSGDYALRAERQRAVPEVWGFVPASGIPGTRVLVRGTNFLDGLNPVVTGVEFVAAPANWDEPVNYDAGQEFITEVPPGAVSGPIRVLTAGAEGRSTNDFVVLSPVGGIQRETGGGFSFGVSNAVAGIQNVVEHATTLTPPIVWTPMTTNVTGAGVWRFTNATPGVGTQQFFRVRRQ